MIYNSLMAELLSSVPHDSVRPQNKYPIWQSSDLSGRPFWGTGSFCGLSAAPAASGSDLTALEWSGNEIRLSLCDFSSVQELFLYALGIVKAWKNQMEAEFSPVPFDILLSVDPGDEQIPLSATPRFWAVRDNKHYVSPSLPNLENSSQPVLMEQANYRL